MRSARLRSLDVDLAAAFAALNRGSLAPELLDVWPA
jgi:hypothetical protein